MISMQNIFNYLMSEAFVWALKIWFCLLVPSFPARSRRIQLPLPGRIGLLPAMVQNVNNFTCGTNSVSFRSNKLYLIWITLSLTAFITY